MHEIETQEKLSVHIKDPLTDEMYDATDILPKYFYISVPPFNDRLEKEIDDWLYIMKYDDIPHPFRSAYMERVAERLGILKMTSEERAGYYSYLKRIYTDRDELQAATAIGEARGEVRGKALGKAEAKLEIARKLLVQNRDIPGIADLTGLYIEEIEQLSREE